jgi:branched-chain amino acid transport system ATP-binding protein
VSLLEAEGLRRTFGGVTAVDDVSFAVEEADLVGVVGANGSGKTTTINLLTRLIRVSSGHMRMAGKDYTHAAPHTLPSLGLARTFQHVRLFHDLSVRENVGLAASAHERTKHGWRRRFPSERKLQTEVAEQLGRAGLADFADARPAALSYGVQRVVEVVRALTVRPRLIFLDEPFAGMDTAEAEMLARLLLAEQQRTGLAVVIVDHNVEALLTVAQRLLAFGNGKIIASGTPADVLRDEAVVQSYVGTDV